MHYFSSDYITARQAFLGAAETSCARVQSFQNPVQGAGELFTDVVTAGADNAERVLVLISGTHGVEGFAGSAIQSGLLHERLLPDLPDRTKLVMIHALNPFGFACLRRFNEDNIDLNRNFVDHAAPYPENPEYDALADVIAPQSLAFAANCLSMLKIYWLRLIRGHTAMQRAVTYGQYNHPEGLFYGGNEATWSNRLLHEIVANEVFGAKKVIAIDFHTGLGPYGTGEIILNDPEEDPAYRRAVNWWGEDRVKSTVRGESVSAHLIGTIKLAFDRMLPGSEVTGIGLEFGTLPPMQVFLAMRAENWLYHHGQKGDPRYAKIKSDLMKAFCPDDEVWKGKVWAQGSEIVKKAVNVLASSA